jgi:uncharacterized SAM-binding protein YcdF (DUF218 family)
MSLAKFVFELVFPLGILLFLQFSVLSLISRHRVWARVFVMLTVLFVWFTGMPATSTWLIQYLEKDAPPIRVEDASRAEAIVVLGGGLASRLDNRTVPRLGDQANRLWFAARLYQEGKAPFILVSGGGEPPEAPIAGEVLEQWGIPRAHILLESQSRTTRQNAQESRRIAKPLGLDHILLVTTASHMPRAAFTFEDAGFDVLAFPVGHQANPKGRPLHWRDWIPNVGALKATSQRLMEVAARMYYQYRGWI